MILFDEKMGTGVYLKEKNSLSNNKKTTCIS
jgi:hypothetical protein